MHDQAHCTARRRRRRRRRRRSSLIIRKYLSVAGNLVVPHDVVAHVIQGFVDDLIRDGILLPVTVSNGK